MNQDCTFDSKYTVRLVTNNVGLKFISTNVLFFVMIYKTDNNYVMQDEIDREVQTLLSLKKQYKDLTGEDLAGGGGRKDKKDKKANKENKPEGKKEKAEKHQKQDKAQADDGSRELKKQTRLVLPQLQEE